MSWKKIKMFMWYIITEPLRALPGLILAILLLPVELFKEVMRTGAGQMERSSFWVVFFLVSAWIFLYFNSKLGTYISLATCLIFVISWEWKRGMFIHRWREIKERRE